MIISRSHERRDIGLIILIALLIHLFLSLGLFISDFTHDRMIPVHHIMRPEDTPIVFQEDEQQLQQQLQQPQQEQWASMTAAPSSFGIPDEHAQENVQESLQSETGTNEEQEELEQEQAPIAELQRTEPFSPTTIVEMPAETYDEKKLKPSKTRKGKARLHALPLTQEQQKAAQQLATVTRGYLDQLQSSGNNMVTLIGGDTSRLPTAEQFKYERYWAKLQWSLQHSLYGNSSRYQTKRTLQCLMRVLCSIKRDGSLADLKIVDSSGDVLFDKYIQYAFEQAAFSFPPLPSFITTEPYNVIWVVQVDINGPLRWSFNY